VEAGARCCRCTMTGLVGWAKAQARRLPRGRPVVRRAHAERSKRGEDGLRGHGAALYLWTCLHAWSAPLPTLQAVALALFLATAAFAQAPMPVAKTQLVPFDTSPFPYSGPVPDKGITFLDVVNGERRGHTSLRGGVYWEDLTYSDKRVLLFIPRGFDIRR